MGTDNAEKKPYGFIYITTNKINNKKYIGQKKFDNRGRWKSYLGSGYWLMKAIDKYGKENFYREIVGTSMTEEELNQKEYEWIKKHNAVEDSNFYNMMNGGDVTESLKRRNSTPCICIDNNMVFRSIADASSWSGYTFLTIKKTFKKKHSFNKKEKLIFRPLSRVRGVKVKKKLCCVCGDNFTHKSNCQKYCEQCISIKGKKKLIVDHDFEKSNVSGIKTYTLNDKWVKDYIKEHSKRKAPKRRNIIE